MILKPGVHIEANLDSLTEPLQEAAKREFRVFNVDLGGGISNKQELFDRLKTGLRLPDYFGANWDALEESLRDLDIGQNTGFLLAFRSADALLVLSASDLRALVLVLNEAARFWQSEGMVFSSLFVGSATLAEAIASASQRPL